MSSAAGPIPPQPPHDFSYNPSRVSDAIKNGIERTRKLEDEIAALKPADCTFDSVVKPLALDEAVLDTETDPAGFMQSVSTDKLVRDAATEASMKLSDFGIESSMRKDIYDRLRDVQKNTAPNSLDPESQRLLDRMLRDKTRAGLGLSEKDQKKFKDLKTQISNKCIAFQKNCDEERGILLFTKEELDGVPEDVIAGYPKESLGDTGVQYKVTHKTPDIVPVLRYCKVPATRRRAYLSYENRNQDNTQLFKEIIELRRAAGQVMKYQTYADYVIEPKMAKTAKTVIDFLTDLREKVKPIGEKERDRLMALKKEECKELGIEFEDVFYAWDYRYYDRLYTQRTLDLDNEKVKEYLPVSVVVPRMMQLYSDLLGIQCFPVKDASTWHEEVTVWAVWDKEGLDKQVPVEESFCGYLYLDLFPREAKYGHAAVWGLIPGYEKADGSRQYSTSAMVANLAKPTSEKPALLSHDDFVTLFHEMGHAYHGLLSHTTYSRFHGTKTSRDFVEAPSQMLENWTFAKPVLRMITSHYKTGESIPNELIEKIIQSDAVNKGLFNLRQLYFGLFDMKCHTSPDDQDYTKLWNELREDIALTSIGNADLPQGQGSFAHLAGGYEAGYYGYLYSLSFATDMFYSNFKADPLSQEMGMKYRREILQPGGSREEMDSLTAFLGRKPNNEAFMKKLLAGASS